VGFDWREYIELARELAGLRGSGYSQEAAERSAVSRAYFEASIGLAHGLKLKTVAEGIETPADWEALKGMGCDLAQGYFIARPLDEAAFAQFCRAIMP
jgi:EAL domain-containing protein (putative c-di-GMP-specific phosphodiesterase class I)